MFQSKHVTPLYDAQGTLYGVLLSATLWEKYHNHLEPILDSIKGVMEPNLVPKAVEPLHEWEEFKGYWDFKYPLTAEVVCNHCGNHTEDWVADPTHPFWLKSAQLGGLVVFRCNNCEATVRKKHFKDHVCYEYSIGTCGGGM